MEHDIYVQCLIPTISSVRNVDKLTFFPASTPFPKMKTEYYLWWSVGNIIAFLSKPKTQLPLFTYGGTTKIAVESIAKILPLTIPREPPEILTLNPTSTSEQTIPAPKQSPINFPSIRPTMSTIPV